MICGTYTTHMHTHLHTFPHVHIQSHCVCLTAQRNMWHEHAERTRRQWAAHAPLLAPEHLDTRLSISRPIWPIWPTFPPRPPLVPRVNVTLRDVVTYRDNTITVGRGGEVVRRWAWLCCQLCYAMMGDLQVFHPLLG